MKRVPRPSKLKLIAQVVALILALAPGLGATTRCLTFFWEKPGPNEPNTLGRQRRLSGPTNNGRLGNQCLTFRAALPNSAPSPSSSRRRWSRLALFQKRGIAFCIFPNQRLARWRVIV